MLFVKTLDLSFDSGGLQGVAGGRQLRGHARVLLQSVSLATTSV